MKRMKRYFSLIVLIALFIFFGFYLKNNLDGLLSTFSTTIENLTRYFFLAAIFVLVSFYFLIKSYQMVFRMNGLNKKVWDLFKLNFAGMAVNILIPTAGISQAVIFAEDAKRKDEPRTATINSLIITYISDYTGISIILIFALIYLYLTDKLIPHVFIPGVIFLAITVGTYFLSYLAGKESKKMENFLLFIVKIIEKPVEFLLKKKIKFKDSVLRLYKEFKSVNKAIMEDPKDWVLTIVYALIQDVFSVAAIYVIFISLGYEPLFRDILAAHAIGAVFVVISPTPNGIGFVEGGMFLVFTALGIPVSIASTAIVMYRALSFWLPLAFGFVTYQRMKLLDIIES